MKTAMKNKREVQKSAFKSDRLGKRLAEIQAACGDRESGNASGEDLLSGLVRGIHFIDIENLVGAPRPTIEQVRAAKAVYLAEVPCGPNDQFVLACNHLAAEAVSFGWGKNAVIRMRSGPDGADLELLDAIEEAQIPLNWIRVIVASGDGIFTETVAHLGAQGAEVTVVSRRGSLSKRLEVAAKKHMVINTDRVIAFPTLGEAA